MKIDENNYVDKAEKVITGLKNKVNQRTGKAEPMVTTSKIRNLLAMSADIYNEVMLLKDDALDKDICGKIEYLRIRFVYEAGREPKVKDFVLSAEILDILKEIKGSRSNYILFNRYMEALIAFHKYYGGKD